MIQAPETRLRPPCDPWYPLQNLLASGKTTTFLKGALSILGHAAVSGHGVFE